MNPVGALGVASITNTLDFNRDGRVNARDFGIARLYTSAMALPIITPNVSLVGGRFQLQGSPEQSFAFSQPLGEGNAESSTASFPSTSIPHQPVSVLSYYQLFGYATESTILEFEHLDDVEDSVLPEWELL